MKVNIDPSKIINALLMMAILGAVGAIWDFQGVKGEVLEVKQEMEGNRRRLEAVSRIVCMYAIRDKLPSADKICQEVLRGNK